MPSSHGGGVELVDEGQDDPHVLDALLDRLVYLHRHHTDMHKREKGSGLGGGGGGGWSLYLIHLSCVGNAYYCAMKGEYLPALDDTHDDSTLDGSHCIDERLRTFQPYPY